MVGNAKLQGLGGLLRTLLRGLAQLLAKGHRLVQSNPLQILLVVGNANPLLCAPELLDAGIDLPIDALLPVLVSIEQRGQFGCAALLQELYRTT